MSTFATEVDLAYEEFSIPLAGLPVSSDVCAVFQHLGPIPVGEGLLTQMPNGFETGQDCLPMLLNQPILEHKFDQAIPYNAFVATGESLGHRPQWDQRYGQLALDDQQQALVQSFTRHMPILTLTGTWCGDCALQGAALHRIAEANPSCFDLRFLPRTEEHADLITRCQVNAGFRVPMVWIMSEDLHPLAVLGDRPLSRYRSMALKGLGDRSNVRAQPPADPVRTVLQELLDEVERTQLMLRLSPRLREKYGD